MDYLLWFYYVSSFVCYIGLNVCDPTEPDNTLHSFIPGLNSMIALVVVSMGMDFLMEKAKKLGKKL